MATACGLTLIKKFPYRGNTSEEFSNQYWFINAPPSSVAGWDTLRDALITEEKKLYPSYVTVIRAYGYDSDVTNADSVYQSTLTTPVPGTLVPTGGIHAPGDAAVWVRWATSRSANGKKIYLRKYFHGAWAAAEANNEADLIHAAQKTALTAFGAKMRDGTFLDSRTLTARGHSDTLISHKACDYLTTRTLKRRGKRPPTS